MAEQLSTINLSTGDVTLWGINGEIASERRWSTTEVSGGGGGGFLSQGTGVISHRPIQSTTTTHDQLFVRDDGGGETVVDLVGGNVAVRPGHRVSVVWGIRSGRERGPYLGLYNHHTDTFTQFSPWALVTSRFSLRMRVILAFVAAVAAKALLPAVHFLSSAFFFGLLGSALVGWYLRRQRASHLRHAATQALRSLAALPQYRAPASQLADTGQ